MSCSMGPTIYGLKWKGRICLSGYIIYPIGYIYPEIILLASNNKVVKMDVHDVHAYVNEREHITWKLVRTVVETDRNGHSEDT